MNLRKVLLVTALGPWIGHVGATPTASPEQEAKSVAQLIKELSDASFKTREQATQALWQLGPLGVSDLERAANGGEPEQAYRARELIRKIALHITPQTDPAVIAMVERYGKANTNEKLGLLDRLQKKRAWHQILKLFAAETDPEVQSRFGGLVAEIAAVAARECLAKGDANAAREFLEMAPADFAGLIALAAFHRNQGTLDAELSRAKTLAGRAGLLWQLALYRVKGDLAAARDVAAELGESKVSATMAGLLGDPLPWMKLSESADEEAGNQAHALYVSLAVRRWQGKFLTPIDLEQLIRLASSDDTEERGAGISSLFLLGESALAENALVKTAPLEAFAHFDSLERIPEALTALGIDPDKPDYAAWVEQRFTQILKDPIEDEDEGTHHLPELLALASFFESRGLYLSNPDIFGKPLATLAEKDSQKFVRILQMLLTANRGTGSSARATSICKSAAIAWAGENNEERWREVLEACFGESDEVRTCWDWLAVLDPRANRSDRFSAMLVFFASDKDPEKLREKWLTLAWAAIEQAPQDQRAALTKPMAIFVSMNGNATDNLRLLELIHQNGTDDDSTGSRIYDLAAAERWQPAADFFLDRIERLTKNNASPEPYFHAAAAATLRKAGKPALAAIQDALVEKFALGRNSLEIARGYAFGYDYLRASEWLERSTRLSDPNSGEFSLSLATYNDELVSQGKWQIMASISEMRAQISSNPNSENISESASAIAAMRYRIHSDLGRALAKLKTDRAAAIALLDRCRQISPNDGSMADSFFPSLRKAGLLREHDAWFDQAFSGIVAVVERFPDAENTLNSAGWMAARAKRNLDQAENFLDRALARSPSQAAYLDTMAEIHFARGNRQKAIAWSSKALNFMPTDPMIRRQHERFLNEALTR